MFSELPPDVVALLARQHGVATAGQLHAATFTQRRCGLAVDRGLLLHPRRGRYIDRATWRSASEVTRNAMRLLAVQLVASDAVGIDATAAMVWQLSVRRPPDRPEVVRTSERGRLTGAVVRHRRLHPSDVEVVEALTVTSIAATGASVASTFSLPDALITLDAVLRRGVSIRQLQDAASRLPNAAVMRRAERAITVADPWSESWLESLSRGRVIEVELPAPLCNVTLVAEGREARG